MLSLMLALYHDINPLQLPGLDGGIGNKQCKSIWEREREKWGRVMSSQAVIDALVHYWWFALSQLVVFGYIY